MTRRPILLALILPLAGALSHCASGPTEAEQNQAIVRQAFDALSDHEYDRLDAVIAAGYRRHCQATPEAKVESLDDFKALLRLWDESFPDAAADIAMLVAQGDLVAFYGTFTGTQTGPMGPFPATGKTFASEFSGIHRIEAGKIAETWVTWDNMAILGQLGLYPPPEDSGEGS